MKVTQKFIMASAALTAYLGLVYGSAAIAAENTHKILNQAMHDVAHALGDTQAKLASLH